MGRSSTACNAKSSTASSNPEFLAWEGQLLMCLMRDPWGHCQHLKAFPWGANQPGPLEPRSEAARLPLGCSVAVFFLILQRLLVCFKIKACIGTLGSLSVWKGERGCIFISFGGSVGLGALQPTAFCFRAGVGSFIFCISKDSGRQKHITLQWKRLCKSLDEAWQSPEPCWHQLRKHWCTGKEQW